MENNTEINVVLNKKMEAWKFNERDYIAPHEITVTITLNEYRDLVEKNAKASTTIAELEGKYRKAVEEIKCMTEALNCLRNSIECKSEEKNNE